MRSLAEKYTEEEKKHLAYKVVDGMQTNGISTHKACEAADLPITTFMRWVQQDKTLQEHYAQARQALIERIAAEVMEIADAPPEREPLTGKIDAASVRKQQLQVDTRKWLLSKLAPKRYGEKVVVVDENDSPLQINNITRQVIDVAVKPVESLPDES
jgi:phenylpyruvate tautomerase PptA (4-oxalocrotonate tautomerase family)